MNAFFVLVVAACGGGPAERQPPVELRCETNPQSGCYRRIPGGTFVMGAQSADPAAPGFDPSARPEEGPPRSVTVAPFWMMEEEVPYRAWERCVQQGACVESADEAARPKPGFDAHRNAVGGISWTEARALCVHLGGRLPTEAEWEIAARGTEGRRWPWGDRPPCGLGTSRHLFDELPTNEWESIPGCASLDRPQNPRAFTPEHLMDLAWGHWEWVEDAWVPPPGGPRLSGDVRVQKGGSWTATEAEDVRGAARVGMPADARVFDVGVRCAW